MPTNQKHLLAKQRSVSMMLPGQIRNHRQRQEHTQVHTAFQQAVYMFLKHQLEPEGVLKACQYQHLNMKQHQQ
ncbi:hypothetical protein ASU87_20930 [Enterobacter roggenkampii]|nr:hypothetical protein ASU87_20930 [Enterobacter roggenkampii]